MHDNRLSHLARKADETRERPQLRVPRRVIVVEVEADLADGHHFGEPGELDASPS